MKKFWNKSFEYRRILEILDDYWLTEPEEKEAMVEMHFLKANGETQSKQITWFNPNMEHDNEIEIINLADAFREEGLELNTMADFKEKPVSWPFKSTKK